MIARLSCRLSACPSACPRLQRAPGLPARPFARQALRGIAPASRTQGAGRAFGARVMASTSLADQIKEKNDKYPVMVYAKTYCPYCSQVKALFKKLNVDFMAADLDNLQEGPDLQSELGSITGSSTVPQVFIGGNFIGGCDDTEGLHRSGELKKLLDAAGVSNSA